MEGVERKNARDTINFGNPKLDWLFATKEKKCKGFSRGGLFAAKKIHSIGSFSLEFQCKFTWHVGWSILLVFVGANTYS